MQLSELMVMAAWRFELSSEQVSDLVASLVWVWITATLRVWEKRLVVVYLAILFRHPYTFE
jgi:hypothetical protein